MSAPLCSLIFVSAIGINFFIQFAYVDHGITSPPFRDTISVSRYNLIAQYNSLRRQSMISWYPRPGPKAGTCRVTFVWSAFIKSKIAPHTQHFESRVPSPQDPQCHVSHCCWSQSRVVEPTGLHSSWVFIDSFFIWTGNIFKYFCTLR